MYLPQVERKKVEEQVEMIKKDKFYDKQAFANDENEDILPHSPLKSAKWKWKQPLF